MTYFLIVNCVTFPLITKYYVSISAESVNQSLNEVQIVACEQDCCQFFTTSVITNCILYYVSNTFCCVTIPEIWYSARFASVVENIVRSFKDDISRIPNDCVGSLSDRDWALGIFSER